MQAVNRGSYDATYATRKRSFPSLSLSPGGGSRDATPLLDLSAPLQPPHPIVSYAARERHELDSSVSVSAI